MVPDAKGLWSGDFAGVAGRRGAAVMLRRVRVVLRAQGALSEFRLVVGGAGRTQAHRWGRDRVSGGWPICGLGSRMLRESRHVRLGPSAKLAAY